MLTANASSIPLTTDNSWRTHYRASFHLGVPFVGAQLAQLAINTTDVLMVGKLGATELAAIILATQMYFTVYIFGSGFANAVVPMAAQAVGGATRSRCAAPCAWACGSSCSMAC